jgi:hypothetical protein
VLAGAYDVSFFARRGPRWYLWLRVALTLVVVIALAATVPSAPAGARLVDLSALLSAAP